MKKKAFILLAVLFVSVAGAYAAQYYGICQNGGAHMFSAPDRLTAQEMVNALCASVK